MPPGTRAASPAETEAYRLMRGGRYAEALPLAVQAVKGQRVCLPSHGLLATLFLKLGRADDAERVIEESLTFKEGIADAYDALAHASLMLGQHERSNELYRRVVALAPNDPRFLYNLASSERSFGRLAEAEAACDKAIALDRNQYATYLLRSELRAQSQESNHIDELGALLLRRDVDERARVLLGYALAKELDDVHRFDEAFQCFAAAASLRRSHLAYDVSVDEKKLSRIQQAFAVPVSHEVSQAPARIQYIFIVGLPRSGTTLVEHILTGLPNVRSNGETENFSDALLSAAPAQGGDVFARASAADLARVAENYSKAAVRGSRGGAVIEKLPMNYLYLGAIRRALPQAKIILVKRQPMDSCFAMYRTLFGSAYPFSYDFEDLARYFAAYERLMAHWRMTIGDGLFEVEYEALVKHPQQIGEQIARHCKLDWNPEALEVHRSATVSFTASAAQIRRPIYGSSSGKWRLYGAHLQPLIEALRRNKVSVPEDV